MNTADVQAEINEAHTELATLLNTLINTPVNERAEQVAYNLAFDLKDELGKRLTGLKTDIKTVLEASEELEKEIEALQRGTARLETNANKHQEKHEERHQHLLSELSNVITIGVDNVIERLDHSHLQQFLKAHATLGNLSTRVDELRASQTQAMVEVSTAFETLKEEIEALQRGTARLEANSNKHQSEHEGRHQRLLSDLTNVVTSGVENVIERLDHSNLQQFLKAHATLGNLSTRVDELRASQTQTMVEVNAAFDTLNERLMQAEMIRIKAIKKDAGRFMWVIGAVTVNLLMGGSLLFHLFPW